MKKIFSILLMLMCISFFASAQTQPRCNAMTQTGTQCSREAKKDDYCTQHYNMQHPPRGDARCKAITQKETQYTRKATKGGFCTQHFNIEQKKQQQK